MGAPTLAVGAAWAAGLATFAATEAAFALRVQDEALVRGMTPWIINGSGQGQESALVDPEHGGLALPPLLDPA